MKKIKYIILLCSLFLSGYKIKAQLLNAGDAIMSMSGNVWNGAPPNQTYVLEIFRTSNTSAAPPPSAVWVMTTPFYNSYSYKHPSWIRDTMGNVFGLTIDNNRNIYATATGFYGTQVAGKSTGSVWRIDGMTGAVSLLKDLHSGGQNAKCLGNIKFFNGFLYVSNLADGKIYVINVSSPATNYTPFDPGGTTDTRTPHGLAIRNVAGSPRLFFSVNAFTAATTEIHSIGISGSSFTGVETTEITGLSINSDPVTDIAFNQDFSRIILAEKTTSSWTSTFAHASRVLEYKFNGSSWINQSMNYQVGTYGIKNNCAGGLSFSKHILFKDKQVACDTTIWATSDAIFYPGPPSCYGITGFQHAVGAGSQTGVNIDADNNYNEFGADKYKLGDVEVLDTTINCASCACGTWGTSPVNITFPTVSKIYPCGGSYSAPQGNLTGILDVSYACVGSCTREMNWQLLNITTNSVVASGNTTPIDLSKFNNLPCAQYRFVFTPVCGGAECRPCEFNLVITCDPPVCCDRTTIIGITPQAATYTSNPNPNLWGVYSQAFTLNSNIQISEFRVNVEHFELNSTDPDCIPCRNNPKTWGSLVGGSYNGNGLVYPSSSLPFNQWYLYSNGREMDYKPGFLFTMVNGQLRLNIAMPNVSPVDCCRLTANVCLKFTFKDKDCKECTYIYCNSNILLSKMIAPPNGNPVDVDPRVEVGSITF